IIINTTKEQQKELDDALVAPENHLKIGKYNLRLSSNIKYKEPTLQVVLEALKLTPFYNAFEISANVPKIYMQEFWVTVTRHHSSLRFKLDGKSHTVNWEDLVFQVENKNSKKNNDMYYPCFTKVIIDYFMAKDQAILRINKMFWHYTRDDFMFTTIRVISKHKDTQEYDAILPQHLTNQAMLESKAFKTYRAYATGEKAPKSKATKKKTDSESSPKTKPSQASKGKRIKISAKGDKPATTKSKGDGVDLQSKVPDEQQQTLSGTNEGAGDKPEVPDVPEYKSESKEESWTFNQGDDDEESDEHDSANEDDKQQNDSEDSESEDDRDEFVHLTFVKPRSNPSRI
ncbi:hypothetical protein Tco_1443246, partial [Tanacetum coccineum]